MGASKETKQKRFSNGFCERCGKFPFREGKKTCQVCFEKIQEYEKQDRERRKEKGLCQKCPNKAVEGCVYCEIHLSGRRKYAKIKSDKRIVSGLCTNCGNEKNENKRLCNNCFQKQKETQRIEYLERQQSKNCVYCGKLPSLTKVNSCKLCFFKNLSANHFRSRSRYQELINLFDSQNGLCAITGFELILGDNASLDHILPLSKGGTHDISNLRFVHLWINFVKLDKLDEEFIPELKMWANLLYEKFGEIK